MTFHPTHIRTFLHPGNPRGTRIGTREATLVRERHFDKQEAIFAVALGVIALHALALAALADVSVWRHLMILLATVVVLPAFFLLFMNGNWAVRACASALAGLFAISTGLALFVPHLLLIGGEATAYTGTVATVAGLVLIGLAFAVAFAGRRWRIKLLALPLLFVILQWVVLPAIGAGLATNAPRETIAEANTLQLPGARDVSFPASDGVRLAGWYVPGENGAVVILMHGSHGDRTDTLAHLRMLVSAGYAALAFDARGHGESAGSTNALGWGGEADVQGAVRFLQTKGVDPARIAALGLSMGGEEALRAAADGVGLRAVVADGAGASTEGDQSLTERGALASIAASESWLSMRATEAISGQDEPPALKDIVSGINVPTLLIASNAADELAIDQAFQQRIGSKATLWHIPDAGHTEGLAVHPGAYRERVLTFLANFLSQQ